MASVHGAMETDKRFGQVWRGTMSSDTFGGKGFPQVGKDCSETAWIGYKLEICNADGSTLGIQATTTRFEEGDHRQGLTNGGEITIPRGKLGFTRVEGKRGLQEGFDTLITIT